MKRIFIVFLLLLSCSFAKSQIQVFGKITDVRNNEPLIGVSVEIINNPISRVYTDDDGYYQITIPDIEGSTVLTFSYVGYRTQQIQMYSKNVDVNLQKGFAVKEVVTKRIIPEYERLWNRSSFAIKGQVLGVGQDDVVGDPLIGVVVSVNGGSVQTLTDENGYYWIRIPAFTDFPKLHFYYLEVQQIIPVNESVEILDVYLYDSIYANFQPKIGMFPEEVGKEPYFTELTLYSPRVFTLSLTGSLPQTNFGIGVSFDNVYMGKRTSFTLSGNYYTDFKNNSRIFGDLQLYQLVRGFDLKFDLNKFDIPEKAMDMCVYRGDIYWQPSMDVGFSLYYGMEYIDHKSKFMRGITSLIFGTEFRIMPRGYFSADIGFTDSGPAHFMFGYKYHASPKMPFDINIEGGSWMRKLRVDTSISRKVKNVIFRLGYEKLYKYDNAYLTLTVPLF